ncbi:Inner membrane protein YihY, formerly thought to be RNase BN [Desulfovibrio sp. TomC]|nr:Inner membrane protein YihY, formerly thought to be RNase BN [Desulfovibrio sp. TomC]
MAAWLRELARLGGEAISAFFRSGGPTQAAALAFYALLSSVPLLFAMLALSGAVSGESWTGQMALRRQLAAITPYIDEVLVSRARRLLWASAGFSLESVLFLLWSSWLFLGALRRALALPWRQSPPPAVSLVGRVWGALWGGVGGVLFVGAVTAAMYLAYLPRLEPQGSLLRQWSALWGVGCLTGLFAAAYVLFLPGRRPLRAILAVSAGLAAAGWGVSLAFARLVAVLPRYELVYGSLSGAVLFLLWLDYNAWLVLLGAWFLHLWQRDHAPSALHRRLSPAGWIDRLRSGRLTGRNGPGG